MARKSKKSEAVVEQIIEQAPIEATPENIAAAVEAMDAIVAEATIEAQPEAATPVEEVAQVTVANDERITGITKANYKANLARANELKAKLISHLAETGGFPSHRFVQKTWGYNISLKAIIRHKDRILQAQNLDKSTIKTTDSLPRPKKVKVETVQEVQAPELVA